MVCINIAATDPKFPALLMEIQPRVQQLACLGDTHLLDQPCIAFVGSRKCTDYGKRTTYMLIESLVAAGLTIVSGLAYGIDSHAHKAAIAAGGKTIAVLASGLQAPLPNWQKQLAKEITDSGGLLLSEQTAQAPALRHHFLLRNRIIAGLSLGTTVVEAANKSGALVTANYALEANRTVFAVPGDIDKETSIGTNRLIAQGATPVRTSNDILAAIHVALPRHVQELLSKEQKLLSITRKPLSLKQLMTTLNEPQHELIPLLTRLELNGSLTHQPDGKYVASI